MESKLIKTYWNDGLIDILLAAGLIIMGIFWQLDLVVGGVIAPPVLVSLWVPIRRKVIDPRLGYISFSEEREQKTRGFLLIMGLVGILAFLFLVAGFFFAADFGSSRLNWVAALPAALLATPVFATGLLIKSRRFFYYAGVLLLSGIAVVVTDSRPGAAFLFAGVVVLIFGIRLMNTFFKATKHSPENQDR